MSAATPAQLLEPGWRARSVVSRDPFPWVLTREFLALEPAAALAQAFPEHGYRIAGRGEPGYRFRYRTLISRSEVRGEGLPEVWQAFATELASAGYRRTLGDLLGCDTGGLEVDAALCVYEPGCWLRPHTDREMRVLTQVLYFNPEWEREWGGCLRLLGSERIEDAAVELAPAFNTAVAFCRSERSWHAVSPLAPGVHRSRRSLLLQLTR